MVTTTTSASASGPATGARKVMPASQFWMWSAMRAPPTTPVSTATRVMPTCTVGRKRCGSSASVRAVVAPTTPLRSSTIRRPRRADTRAISVIENSPFNNISSRTTRISKQSCIARWRPCAAPAGWTEIGLGAYLHAADGPRGRGTVVAFGGCETPGVSHVGPQRRRGPPARHTGAAHRRGTPARHRGWPAKLCRRAPPGRWWDGGRGNGEARMAPVSFRSMCLPRACHCMLLILLDFGRNL